MESVLYDMDKLLQLKTLKSFIEEAPFILDRGSLRIRVVDWKEGQVFVFLLEEGRWTRHPKETIREYQKWSDRDIFDVTLKKLGDFYYELNIEV